MNSHRSFEALIWSNSAATVAKDEEVLDTISKVVKDFGKIDVFVANAGTFSTMKIHIRIPLY